MSSPVIRFSAAFLQSPFKLLRLQISGVVSAITVLVMLLFVTPVLRFLPSAVLSAIIIVAVSRLIDISGAKQLWQTDKRDFATMLAAFCSTLLLGVLLGVVVAIAFAVVLFIAFTTQPKVEELGRLEGTVIYRHIGMMGVTKVPDVKLLRFLAPLFFANCT
jgi:sulfate permease, SulP family